MNQIRIYKECNTLQDGSKVDWTVYIWDLEQGWLLLLIWSSCFKISIILHQKV